MLFNSLNSQWLNFNRNALGLFLGSRPRWRWPASIPSWSISSCFQSQTSWLPPWRWCTITSHPKKITKTISADGHQKCTLWRGMAYKFLDPPKWIWKKQCQRWLFFWFPFGTLILSYSQTVLWAGPIRWIITWVIEMRYCKISSGLIRFHSSRPEISEKSWTIKYAMKEVTTSHFCYHYPCQNPRVNPGVNPKKWFAHQCNDPFYH